MADDKETSLLDDVRAAQAELEGGNDGNATGTAGENGGADRSGHEVAQPAASSEAVGRVRSEDGRARDESGRFAKAEEGKPRETLTLKEKPGAEQQPDGGQKPSQPVTDASAQGGVNKSDQPGGDKPAPILAPTEWKGLAKTRWEKLPREVQAEIVERHQAAEQRVAAYAPIEQAIAPYREAWMRDAGSVEAAIGQLGQFYRLYLDKPYELIHHIARTRGIDLGAPQGQQPPQGGAPPQAPDIASLVSQVVQQHIAPIQQRFAQDENQQLNDTISAFASDPKHPFFQDVKVHMGQLLQAGAAKDLNEAYDQATWANPMIRAHLLAAQSEEAKKQQAAEVEKARKAQSASLRGSPLPGGGNAAANGSASVLDDVRAAAAEIAGA